MHLPALTDEELAHHAEQTFDALTSTDIQQELLKRFHVLLEEAAQFKPVAQFLDEHGMSTDGLVQTLVLLEQFGATVPDTLQKILDRDTKVAAVMKDLAAPLASLQALIPA